MSFTGQKTTQSTRICDLTRNSMKSKPEQVLLNLKTSPADKTCINETSLSSRFALVCPVDELWQAKLNVLSGQAVYHHV